MESKVRNTWYFTSIFLFSSFLNYFFFQRSQCLKALYEKKLDMDYNSCLLLDLKKCIFIAKLS